MPTFGPDHDADAPIDVGRSAFVCSKPLQALNCASIVRHLGVGDARLHVLESAIADGPSFRTFFDATSHHDVFSSVAWHADEAGVLGALAARDHDSLFIEDDRVGRYRTMIPYRTERMVLFEEGIGTYRSNAENSLRGVRWAKWRVLAMTTGCGWEFGSGRLTDVVAVSRPDVYRRLNPRTAHKAIGFPGLLDEIEHDGDRWRAAALDALGRPGEHLGRVALVLATWGGAAPGVLADAADGADVVFYKPHPHDGTRPGDPAVVTVGATWLPAEVLVETLAGVSDQVTVYHHSSSVAFYLRNRHANVEFVDVLGLAQLREILEAHDP